MGTRADFYVGTGESAQWLGSVAWDGYEWAEAEESALMMAKTEEQYCQAVKEISTDRKDWTDPNQGWPWPWDDSNNTDYAYYFKDGKTQFTVFSSPEDGWPDMSERKNVNFGERSGIMIFRA